MISKFSGQITIILDIAWLRFLNEENHRSMLTSLVGSANFSHLGQLRPQSPGRPGSVAATHSVRRYGEEPQRIYGVNYRSHIRTFHVALIWRTFRYSLRESSRLASAPSLDDPRNAWVRRLVHDGTISVGTQRLTEWEARVEIVRRAIDYLQNH